jgi:hypothetical protein
MQQYSVADLQYCTSAPAHRFTETKGIREVRYELRYFQMAFHPDIKDATSVIYPVGQFRWKRVPMGWKRAGAHFQNQLAHTMLSGLLYPECELYIDDVLEFTSSEEELLERLRRLFERFLKYNVTLNPDKCEIGLDRVENVGH